MGRVYTFNPDLAKGERSGRGMRLYTVKGVAIPFVTHVAFDRNVDEGMATVTIYVRDDNGSVILDPEQNAAATATFRGFVKMVHKDVKVEQTPQMRLWANPNPGPNEEPFYAWDGAEIGGMEDSDVTMEKAPA